MTITVACLNKSHPICFTLNTLFLSASNLTRFITLCVQQLYTTFYHGCIIQTGIIRKKISCYMRNSTCRWFIVKKTKVFWCYIKHFWIFVGVRKYRILKVLCKLAFLIFPTIFINWHNKTKLVPASFSYF